MQIYREFNSRWEGLQKADRQLRKVHLPPTMVMLDGFSKERSSLRYFRILIQSQKVLLFILSFTTYHSMLTHADDSPFVVRDIDLPLSFYKKLEMILIRKDRWHAWTSKSNISWLWSLLTYLEINLANIPGSNCNLLMEVNSWYTRSRLNWINHAGNSRTLQIFNVRKALHWAHNHFSHTVNSIGSSKSITLN